ncbi:MAG: ABC transporter substrate-binding protein [Bacillus sp. (in: Bacteria)]|nr:ABC transporter substrate-binding protein [Bacillus sp. (in: firmicutes)]MCM1426287.1 ABC transporter substrate-binding protein [Eubacterium sp.]
MAVLALCFGLAGIFSGCGPFQDVVIDKTDMERLPEEEEDLIVVGFSQLGSESVWRTANSESIQRTLTKENGFFLEFNNARQKQENQIKAIRGFISQRVDYIIFSPVMEDGWETVLQEAKDAGIPVILVDRRASVSESLYTAWVGSDMMKEGEKAGLWLEDYLKSLGREDDEINIVVLQGTSGSSALLGRTAGFDVIAKKHSNWHILEQKPSDFTTAKGKEVMEQFLNKYADIDVVVSQNDDMTFGVLQAMEEKGITTGVNGDVILISFDAVHDALEMVAQGIINVDVECNPEQGEYIMDIIRKLENGETVEKENNVEEKVFTPENVGEYLDTRTY